jgi:prolyl-tRNA editing enzyme YbaK/EbsC (Cys-tRNA(Pro) deacylase)
VHEWPEAVERVATYLRAAGAEARLEEFRAETASATAAAEAVGCDASEIVKSLLFLCDGRAILALVPGDRRADEAKIAEVSGAATARIARAAEVREVTGFSPGAVAPFPLQRVEHVFIDRNLLGHRALWIGAGSTRHLAVLPTPELLRLTRAQPADLLSDN